MMVSHSDDEYSSLLLSHVDELSLSVLRTAIVEPGRAKKERSTQYLVQYNIYYVLNIFVGIDIKQFIRRITQNTQ
jgi:hypothetical protein